VALVRGESAEAVPEALRTGGAHPLAADFRKQGDGRRLAFLKIVASLSDLPLDTLVQRDAQRQVKRVMTVTLGAAVLVVIMAMLLLMALRAREESERRRAAAEGLVEFMLTDLRDRLEGVGRLDVMASVNQRAMSYYSDLSDLERVTDESLRAQVLHRMGQVDERRGDYDAAVANFSQARAITAAVLARRPRSANAIFAHAQSEFFVGLIAWDRNDRAAATRHWREYHRYAEALFEVEPDSVRSLMERAYAEGNLCELDLKGSFDLAAAARRCSASIRFAQAAVDQSPGNRPLVVALANRIGWLARVQVEQRDYRGAIRSREAEAALLDQLLRLDPNNIEYALRRSWADIGVATALIGLGKPGRISALLDRTMGQAEAAFRLNGGDRRVTETMFRAELLRARARSLTGKDFAANLERADRLEAALAAAGTESGDRAKAIRASIWPSKEN
jgi:tetratricopeptide (TPR) repeat protein